MATASSIQVVFKRVAAVSQVCMKFIFLDNSMVEYCGEFPVSLLVHEFHIFLDSSMVEHSAVNRVVVGSSPTRGVFSYMLVWLNGRAADL